MTLGTWAQHRVGRRTEAGEAERWQVGCPEAGLCCPHVQAAAFPTRLTPRVLKVLLQS